jgi:hypothetical protein
MHDDAIVFHNHTAGERVAGAAARASTSARSSRAGRHSVSSAAPCAAAKTSRRVSGPRAVHPDDGRRLEWDGVDIFPVTAEGRIARKDVYSSSATPRVL